MQRIVLKSAAAQQNGDKLPITPFCLNQTALHSPSEFEVTFIVDKVRYQYGFSATAGRIHEEWLLAYPKRRPQQWFGRVWNWETQLYEWELGSNLTGEKQLWQKSTRDNVLFLSTAVQLNSQQLQPVYGWFKTTLHMPNLGHIGPRSSASLCEKGKKSQVMGILRAADLDVEDIVIEKEPFDPKTLPDDIPEPVKEMIAGDLKDKHIIDIKTVHKSMAGETIAFDFEDESDGTQKLFAFAGPWD